MSYLKPDNVSEVVMRVDLSTFIFDVPDGFSPLQETACRTGDIAFFDVARDGTMVMLLVRDGRIIAAHPSDDQSVSSRR